MGNNIVDSPTRGAGVSIKSSTPAEMLGWGPRPWGASPRIETAKVRRARGAGDSRYLENVRIRDTERVRFAKSCLIATAVVRSAGSVNPFASDPGARAPGFMQSRAPRALL
jgi:hypothetical protein